METKSGSKSYQKQRMVSLHMWLFIWTLILMVINIM